MGAIHANLDGGVVVCDGEVEGVAIHLRVEAVGAFCLRVGIVRSCDAAQSLDGHLAVACLQIGQRLAGIGVVRQAIAVERVVHQRVVTGRQRDGLCQTEACNIQRTPTSIGLTGITRGVVTFHRGVEIYIRPTS